MLNNYDLGNKILSRLEESLDNEVTIEELNTAAVIILNIKESRQMPKKEDVLR